MHVHEIGLLRKRSGAKAAERRAARWEALKTWTRRLRFSLGSFGDPRLLAYLPLLRKGLEVCRGQKFDFIIATSPPEVLLLVGRALSRRTGVPWIADFRDLWHHDMVLYRARIATKLSGPLNRWAIKNARVLVTVSQGLQKRLAGYTRREVVLSYNGFLEADRRDSKAQPSVDTVRIAYTGRVYPGKQDPEPLFGALAALRASVPDLAKRLSVEFYGFEDPALRSLIKQHGLEDCVAMRGFVPYRDSMAAQRSADCLLFLDWVDASAEGMMTGKLFEYLGSRRPILAIGRREDTEAARIVRECAAGVTLTSEKSIIGFLQGLVTGPRMPDVPEETVQRFSRERQAVELLEAIQQRLAA